MTETRARVGVGILIVKGDKILLGKRKNAHGDGEYASAGGHLEHLEAFETTAYRELAEEMGSELKIKHLKFLCITNTRTYRPKHYVDIGMLAEWEAGEPQVAEPDKIEFWKWFDIKNPPKPLFAVVANYIEAYKTGKIYFQSD